MLGIARRTLIRSNLKFFPGTKAGFDPSHPASQGLIIATVPIGGNHRNIATGTVGTLTGTPAAQIIGNVGPAVACSGTNRAAFTITGSAVTPSTLAAIFFWSGTNAATQDICGSAASSGGNGVDLSMNASGVPAMRFFATQVATTLPALVANHSYFMVMSGVSGTGYSCAYTNLDTGQIFSQFVSSANTYIGNGTYSVGNVGDGSRPLNGSVGPSMYSGIYLSTAQAQAWAADPWSFWYSNK
jgi:hypothetical protein